MYDDIFFFSGGDVIWYPGVSCSFGLIGPHDVPFFPELGAKYASMRCDYYPEEIATCFVIIVVMLASFLSLT